jgi:segregation and condensation protein B
MLLERDLVKILGKKDEPGRPLLYGTTPNFLEFFGLKSLKDLPTLREFTELNEDSRRVIEKELGETLETVQEATADVDATEPPANLGADAADASLDPHHDTIRPAQEAPDGAEERADRDDDTQASSPEDVEAMLAQRDAAQLSDEEQFPDDKDEDFEDDDESDEEDDDESSDDDEKSEDDA